MFWMLRLFIKKGYQDALNALLLNLYSKQKRFKREGEVSAF